jgi:hypothetical protein
MVTVFDTSLTSGMSHHNRIAEELCDIVGPRSQELLRL